MAWIRRVVGNMGILGPTANLCVEAESSLEVLVHKGCVPLRQQIHRECPKTTVYSSRSSLKLSPDQTQRTLSTFACGSAIGPEHQGVLSCRDELAQTA